MNNLIKKLTAEFQVTNPPMEKDWNLIWVLTGKEVDLGKESETKNRLKTGFDLSRQIIALRLSKNVDQVSIEDLERSGVRIYISGYDLHNSIYKKLKEEGFFKNRFNFPDEKIEIGPLEGNLHTGHQFERFPFNEDVIIVTDAYHIPRSKRYLQKYSDKFSEAIFVSSQPTILTPQLIHQEIDKIIEYSLPLGDYTVGITGANGFIGAELVRRLRSCGVSIKTFDREKHNLGNIDSLKPLVKDCDIIFHLAAITESADPQLFKVNVEGTKNLLAAIKETGSQAHFIFSSSFAVYKPQPKGEVIDEQAQIMPRNDYGKSKFEAEELIRQSQVESTILRFSDVYGPSAQPFGHSVVATFRQLVKERKPITIDGDGKQTRDFLFIDDAVQALLLAMVHEPSTVNICSGNELSVVELVEEIEKIVGKLEVSYKQIRGVNGGFWKGSNKLAKDLLHWSPKVGIHAGLEKTFGSKKKNFELE